MNREQELEEALRDMVYQFAYTGNGKRGRACIHTGGLSALEGAFAVLGMEDPTYTPQNECEVVKCYQTATCGTTESGVSGDEKSAYRRLCGEHYRQIPNPKLRYKKAIRS